MTEFYKKYRPARLTDVEGQQDTVNSLKQLHKTGDIPHFMLIAGPSGCGKTTLARIVMKKLVKVAEIDFAEYNSAQFRGIDMVRDISRQTHLKAIGGKVRCWIIDECHQLTAQAQEAFLKILEDTPEHVYFVFCTTEPNKLKKTIRNRATEFNLRTVPPTGMEGVLNRVCEKEDIELCEEVYEKLIAVSEGSPRKLLVMLQQIAGIEDDDDQLASLSSQDIEKDAIDLCRLLINPSKKWRDVAVLIKRLEHDPEGVRRTIIGYCASIMLKGGKVAPRAMMVFDSFSDNFYDTGKAGLIAAAYDMYHPEE